MTSEPCGDAALLLRLGSSPTPGLSRRIALLRHALLAAHIDGLIDIVPGLVTLLLAFDPAVTSIDTLRAHVAALLPPDIGKVARRTWTVPVCYDESLAPDLEFVAQAVGLDRETVIRLHTEPRYTVYLLGFSPGFPYLGDLAPALALPRRTDPRPRVPTGSVAIATRFTAIYPHETPGGWHLIGRTPLRLFDPQRVSPALLQPGDAVCFSAISLADYHALQEQAAAGALQVACTETFA